MEIGEFGVGRPDFGGRWPRGEALGKKKKEDCWTRYLQRRPDVARRGVEDTYSDRYSVQSGDLEHAFGSSGRFGDFVKFPQCEQVVRFFSGTIL